jgi:hypothetical protein
MLLSFARFDETQEKCQAENNGTGTPVSIVHPWDAAL